MTAMRMVVIMSMMTCSDDGDGDNVGHGDDVGDDNSR